MRQRSGDSNHGRRATRAPLADYDRRHASHSIAAPKTSIAIPEYRLILAVSSGARFSVATPVAVTISPASVKKPPTEMRRSPISPEDQIQRDQAAANHDG